MNPSYTWSKDYVWGSSSIEFYFIIKIDEFQVSSSSHWWFGWVQKRIAVKYMTWN